MDFNKNMRIKLSETGELEIREELPVYDIQMGKEPFVLHFGNFYTFLSLINENDKVRKLVVRMLYTNDCFEK